MGNLSDVDWSEYYEKKVTYPERDDPTSAFGCYAMVSSGDNLYITLSPMQPMGTREKKGNGAVITRWDGSSRHLLRTPYEAGLNAITIVDNPDDNTSTVWVPGTDFIRVYDDKLGSVYSYDLGENGEVLEDARCIEHRHFENGTHILGINGDGAALYASGQGGKVWESTDQGANWSEIANFDASRAYDVMPLAGFLYVSLARGDGDEPGVLRYARRQGDWDQKRWPVIEYANAPVEISQTARLMKLDDSTLIAVGHEPQSLYFVGTDGTVQLETIPESLQSTAIYAPVTCSSGVVAALTEGGIYIGYYKDSGAWHWKSQPIGNHATKNCGALCWWGANVVYSKIGNEGTIYRTSEVGVMQDRLASAV